MKRSDIFELLETLVHCTVNADGVDNACRRMKGEVEEAMSKNTVADLFTERDFLIPAAVCFATYARLGPKIEHLKAILGAAGVDYSDTSEI